MDAIFLDEVGIEPHLDKVTKGPYTFECSLGGGAMMSRKDSSFTEFWNDAYSKAKKSGKVKEVCDQAAIDHGIMFEYFCCHLQTLFTLFSK